MVLLGGSLLLGQIVGSYQISDVLAATDTIVSDDRYPLTPSLILLGAYTKSAQAPFHLWLPHAMAALTTVSA